MDKSDKLVIPFVVSRKRKKKDGILQGGGGKMKEEN